MTLKSKVKVSPDKYYHLNLMYIMLIIIIIIGILNFLKSIAHIIGINIQQLSLCFWYFLYPETIFDVPKICSYTTLKHT